MTRIQLITIAINILFLIYISRLIIKSKLREEYAIVWWVCTGLLLFFSIWAEGLEVMSKVLMLAKDNEIQIQFIFSII